MFLSIAALWWRDSTGNHYQTTSLFNSGSWTLWGRRIGSNCDIEAIRNEVVVVFGKSQYCFGDSSCYFWTFKHIDNSTLSSWCLLRYVLRIVNADLVNSASRPWVINGVFSHRVVFTLVLSPECRSSILRYMPCTYTILLLVNVYLLHCRSPYSAYIRKLKKRIACNVVKH